MGRTAARQLTARQVTTLGPGKHCDGRGLWLMVGPKGSRKWIVRFVIDGKRREMGLGSLDTTSLKEAREKASQARSQAAEGIDPIKARRKAAVVVPTFTQAAAAFIRSKRREWTNYRHARQWVSTLKTHVRPVLGSTRVDQITTEDILRTLKPIWLTRTETASRVQGRIENILDFAAANGWRGPINPARWRGHLDKLLSSPRKVKQQRNGGTAAHHPAMPYPLVPGFVSELRAIESVPARALELLTLTATRTAEVLGARWVEIDMGAAVWTIPASRTKTKREHRVPLSEAAMVVLSRVPRIAGNPFVFVGSWHKRPINHKAMIDLMHRLGYGKDGRRGHYVVHGFRSSFRDWSGETTNFPRDVCEMALGHATGSAVEVAYRRGDLFAKRRLLMEAWAQWCDRGQGGENVVQIRGQAQDVV